MWAAGGRARAGQGVPHRVRNRGAHLCRGPDAGGGPPDLARPHLEEEQKGRRWCTGSREHSTDGKPAPGLLPERWGPGDTGLRLDSCLPVWLLVGTTQDEGVSRKLQAPRRRWQGQGGGPSKH